MMKRIASVLAATTLIACATTAEKKLDEKLVAEGPANRGELSDEARDAIASVPDLTDPQRSDLTSLRQATSVRLDGLMRESLKLRSLMVKDMISSQPGLYQ